MTQLNQNTTDLQSILDAVNALPEAGPSVSGEIPITANGTYDVKKYATANVNVVSNPVLLWTNASPTSGFSSQTINVASGYDGYMVEIRLDSTHTSKGVAYFPNVTNDGIIAAYSLSARLFNYRTVTTANGAIKFSYGYKGTGGSADTNAIPTRIWGVKFTL